MWEYKWARETSQGQLMTRFISHWNSWHSYRVWGWNSQLCLIPGLGDLLVSWPGASPVSLTAPQQCHRHSLQELQIPHPKTATASWAHTLLKQAFRVCSFLTITKAAPGGREPKVPSLPTPHFSLPTMGNQGKTSLFTLQAGVICQFLFSRRKDPGQYSL